MGRFTIFCTHHSIMFANLQLMESRPGEVTEEEYDQGADIQGLRWGVGDIPVKDDFRDKR